MRIIAMLRAASLALAALSVSNSFAANATSSESVSYQGLWLRSPIDSESGWGVNITHQGSILFASWFTYDRGGTGMWLVMSNGTQTSPGNFIGTLYRTMGPRFDLPMYSI